MFASVVKARIHNCICMFAIFCCSVDHEGGAFRPFCLQAFALFAKNNVVTQMFTIISKKYGAPKVALVLIKKKVKNCCQSCQWCLNLRDNVCVFLFLDIL